MSIKSILYDLDGVLCSAISIHFDALNMALKEVANTRIGPEEEFSFNGLPTTVKLVKLAELGRVEKSQFDLIWSKKQEYTKIAIVKNLASDKIKIELHEYTKSIGIKSVCVTNSITETAELMLKCSGQLDYMQFVLSNEMVKHPKPHGEGYIRAMIRLGTLPEETLIVEDSDKGVMAAKSTGANLLVVKDATEVTLDNIVKRLKDVKI